MGEGRSVRLFLPEGTPSGLLTAEIVNWTGHVLAGPRSKLSDALKRPELKKTGVYILFGTPFNSDLPTAYVGEGDDISRRLISHSNDDSKDYWDRFIAITNKDLNLTKAHVRYLEGRLIAQLHTAKKSVVANSTQPTQERLPEADIADMNSFLEEVYLVLPVIGVDFLKTDTKRRETSAKGSDTNEEITFALKHHGKGITARAKEIDGEFVILQGARGDLREAESFHERAKALREQLLTTGRMRQIGDTNFELIEDVAFSSPSAASVFLFGTARNGRTDWIAEGKSLTYGEWKAMQIAQESELSKD